MKQTQAEDFYIACVQAWPGPCACCGAPATHIVGLEPGGCSKGIRGFVAAAVCVSCGRQLHESEETEYTEGAKEAMAAVAKAVDLQPYFESLLTGYTGKAPTRATKEALR